MSYRGLGATMSEGGSGGFEHGPRGEMRLDDETFQQVWGYTLNMSLDPAMQMKERFPYGWEIPLLWKTGFGMWRAADLAVAIALAGYAVLVPAGFGINVATQYFIVVLDDVSPLVTGWPPKVPLYGMDDPLAVLLDPSSVRIAFPDVEWVQAPPIPPAPTVPSGLVGGAAPLQLPNLDAILALFKTGAAQPAPEPKPAPAPLPASRTAPIWVQIVMIGGAVALGVLVVRAMTRKA